MFSAVQQFPGALPAGGNTLTAATEIPFFNTAVDYELPPSAMGVVIRGYITVTAAAGTTSYAIKVRRGTSTITGTQVGNTQTVTAVASATQNIPFGVTDIAPLNPQSPSDAYTVTVTAAGANATSVDGQFELMVPVPGGADI
jgi:hypothetical protein